MATSAVGWFETSLIINQQTVCISAERRLEKACSADVSCEPQCFCVYSETSVNVGKSRHLALKERGGEANGRTSQIQHERFDLRAIARGRPRRLRRGERDGRDRPGQRPDRGALRLPTRGAARREGGGTGPRALSRRPPRSPR